MADRRKPARAPKKAPKKSLTAERPPAGWKTFTEVFGTVRVKKIKQGKVGKKKASPRAKAVRPRKQEKVRRGKVAVPAEVRRTERKKVAKRLGVKVETVEKWEKEGAPKGKRAELEKEAERLRRLRRRRGNKSAREKVEEALRKLLESGDEDKAKTYAAWRKIKAVVRAGMTREEWVRLMREVGRELGLPEKGTGSWQHFRDS